jgi:TRAP transporter TAXI family solute receptor
VHIAMLTNRCTTLAVLMGTMLTACGSSAVAPPPHVALRLSTGTPGAGFYALGQSLAHAFEKSLPEVTLHIGESAGSVSNVDALRRRMADVTFVYSDVAYMAFAGSLREAEGPLDSLRAIAVLRATPLHLLVGSRSGIRTAAGLVGRRVGMGVRGSGTALTASLVLQAFHIDSTAVIAESLRYNDGADRLASGTLDAMFVGASYPAEAVRTATANGARLVPLIGPEIEQLLHDYPFFRATAIPGGTYPNQVDAVVTIGPDSLLVCRADLDEGLVYRLTKAFFDVLPAIAAENQWLRLMDVEQAPAAPIPLHEGAIRYYRERELAR